MVVLIKFEWYRGAIILLRVEAFQCQGYFGTLRNHLVITLRVSCTSFRLAVLLAMSLDT